jgi:uncharacterized membrane protein
VLRARADLLLCAGLALASAVAAALGAPAPLRVAGGLLLALVLPGYAASRALVPSLRLSERVLLALGLSLVVSVWAAVVLDRTTWGLSTRSWTIALTCVTLAASALALHTARGHAVPLHRPGPGAVVAAATLAGFAVAAIALARAPADSGHVNGYTVLWTRPASAHGTRFVVGVESSELRRRSYRLVAVEGGRTIAAWSFELAPGERWTGAGSIPSRSFLPTEVRLRLYRSDRAGLYRNASLTLPADTP